MHLDNVKFSLKSILRRLHGSCPNVATKCHSMTWLNYHCRFVKKKRYQHQILSSASSLIKYHELNFLEMLEGWKRDENLDSHAANFIRVRLIQMFKCNYLIFEKQSRKVVKSYIKAATEMSKLLESHGLANWGILWNQLEFQE